MIRQAWLVAVGFVVTVVCLVAESPKTDINCNNRALVIGTWELVSTEEQLTDGSKRPYLDVGPRGKGYLIYTADGHMCAAAMNPDRAAWKDVNKPTDAEKLRALEGFFGYCGRYEVDTIKHTIYHYPDVALKRRVESELCRQQASAPLSTRC